MSVCLSVCLSVCTPHLFSTRPSDRNQIWHTYSGRYGTHSELKKIDPAHPRGNITSYVTSSNVEYVRHLKTTARRSMTWYYVIGLYRDVWIAAIAWSRTRVTTLESCLPWKKRCVDRESWSANLSDIPAISHGDINTVIHIESRNPKAFTAIG